MYRKIYRPFFLLIALVLMLGLACQSSAEVTQPPSQGQENPLPVKTKAPAQTQPESKTEAPAPASGAVNQLRDVQGAVVQIESEGAFSDPQLGLDVQGSGRGSGFIIDPSGIAVTNNHVVTGGSLLKVWVGGDQGKTYNAKVLGVSECSDLAVIKIDGEDFPYLEWYSGPIDVGMDIYVAGFPLGEPEYSMVKGIISKSAGDGETNWASVEKVLVYDAATNPGNSGGPVITPDGKVVAVHYRGRPGTGQAFGISKEVAEPVVKKLSTGSDLDTIGINGEAVWSDDNSLSGIWVSSVKSGSPADKAGVQGGDIITRLEDIAMASDHTMSQYCDIIRSHEPGDTLNIEILRFATQQVLEGQINGRELEVTFQGGSEGASEGGTDTQPSGSVVVNPDAVTPGDYLLGTEFDDAESWYVVTVPQSDDYQAYTDGGLFYVKVDPAKVTVYAFYDLVLPPDVQIDTYAQKVEGANTNNISLVCRASDAGWYEFSMTSGGYWYIWLYADGDYTQLAKGATTAINLKDAANKLTATCIGNNFTFYINDQEVGSATDRTLKGGGQVGVSAYSEYPGVGIEFDWFAATVPQP